MKCKLVKHVDQQREYRRFPFYLIGLMLVLDTTTLFYFTLRDANPSPNDWNNNVRKWAASVKGPIAQSSISGTRHQSTKSSHFSRPPASTLTSNTSIAPEIHVKEAELIDLDITPKARKVDYGVMATPGGFQDEDEDEERVAALSSPIKSGRRLTSSVRV